MNFMMVDNYSRAYRQVIFQSRQRILVEDVNKAWRGYKNHLIAQWEVTQTLGQFFKGLKGMIFKGWEGLNTACNAIFQILPVKYILTKSGVSAQVLANFATALQGCFVLVPVAMVGVTAYDKTRMQINGQDYILAVDKDRLKDQTKKFFKDKSFLQKATTVIEKYTKNFAIELLKNLPMLMQCLVGYSLASAFRLALQKNSLPERAGEKVGETTASAGYKILGKNGAYQRARIATSQEDAFQAVEQASNQIARQQGRSDILDYWDLHMSRSRADYRDQSGMSKVGANWSDYDPSRNPDAPFNPDGSPRQISNSEAWLKFGGSSGYDPAFGTVTP